jgi:LysM repeat protein
MRLFYYLFFIAIVFSSCQSARWARTDDLPPAANKDAEQYIKEYADLAMSEMRRTGIPASITLAQAVIESDYGRSRLARVANNHFGIKCHNGWTGRRIYHNDDRRGECFRRYRDADESFRDHSDFLQQGSRYDFLFYLEPGDYRGWARGLKSAGYATNPRYANMLIDMIEKNRLHIYDEMVISGRGNDRALVSADISPEKARPVVKTDDPVVKEELYDEGYVIERGNRVKTRNMLPYIVVREGDTFESLAVEFDLFGWELKQFNELDDDAEPQAGQILYLQVKRSRAERGKDYHIVKEGETMHSISQLYGIRLRVLYRKNRMEPGYEPAAGTELWLRKTKPEGL